MQQPIYLVCEGLTDQVVMRRLFAHLSLPKPDEIPPGGKTKILDKLDRYNQTATRFGHWVVVIDLDGEAPTSDAYVKQLLPHNKAEQLIMCVAVQAIESWLLADQANLADYLKVPPNRIPLQPDHEADPKATLMQIVRSCKDQALRDDMLPIPNGTAKQGPGYVGRVSQFVHHTAFPWQPAAAASNSPSLTTCLHLLTEMGNTI